MMTNQSRACQRYETEDVSERGHIHRRQLQHDGEHQRTDRVRVRQRALRIEYRGIAPGVSEVKQLRECQRHERDRLRPPHSPSAYSRNAPSVAAVMSDP